MYIDMYMFHVTEQNTERLLADEITLYNLSLDYWVSASITWSHCVLQLHVANTSMVP